MQDVSFLTLVRYLRSLSLNLEYRAFSISHGAHSGIRKGFEDQLVEYRHYVPGDDLRYLDWRLLARTDKYYIREGFKRARQSIFIWLDTSLSQRFDDDKFRVSWLLALALGYLYRSQNDAVFLYSEFHDEGVHELKGPHDFIRLNEMFSKGDFSRKVSKTTRVLDSLESVHRFLKPNNRVIWLTDMYVPIDDFQLVLDRIAQFKLSLSLFHLVQDKEWQSRQFKRGLFSKLVDAETGDWLPSAHLKNYDTVWEDAINQRVRALVARNHRYIKARVEEGPLKILSGLRSL